MENRYSCAPEHVKTMDTDELRERFLVEDLFADGEVKLRMQACLRASVRVGSVDVNIMTITFAIGGATFLMAAGGMLLGRVLKCRLGCYAEVIAGLVLICVGRR